MKDLNSGSCSDNLYHCFNLLLCLSFHSCNDTPKHFIISIVPSICCNNQRKPAKQLLPSHWWGRERHILSMVNYVFSRGFACSGIPFNYRVTYLISSWSKMYESNLLGESPQKPRILILLILNYWYFWDKIILKN